MILGLHPIDIAIVVASLLGVIALGLWASRSVKHENDFYVGGRSMGPILQFFIFFGNATDSNGAPIVASEVYRQGAAGMWVPFQPLFSTPFYWFASIWWRRTRLITGNDQMIERFNSRRLATSLAMWGVLTAPFGLAMGNMVSYKVASAMFVKPEVAYTLDDKAKVADYHEFQALRKQADAGTLASERKERYTDLRGAYDREELASYITYIEPLPFYICYTLLVLVCILFGGIRAAAYTDILQGILIMIFSFLLLPIGLAKVGGFAGLHDRLPEHMFEIFGSVGLSDYTWYSVAAFVLMGLVCIGTPGGCGAGRNERAVRIGVLTGSFAKRFVMIMWMLAGLLAIAIFQDGIADPENTWGQLSFHLLPVGLIGLMIAGMLLGHMPAVATGSINFSAGFTRNLYEPWVRGRSEKHYMAVAKLSIVGVLSAAILLALVFKGIIALFTTLVSVGAFFGAMGLLMLFWRPLSARAVGWSWIIWMVILVGIPWGLPRIDAIRTLPSLTLMTAERTIQVRNHAGQASLDLGQAAQLAVLSATTTKAHVIAPIPVYFDSMVKVQTGTGLVRAGAGRFHFENWVMGHLGVPVEGFTKAGLNATRWTFDSLGPFALLMVLSLLLPDRRKPARDAAGRAAMPPEEFAKVVMQGNIALLHNPDETQEQAQIRLDRFYAKIKTPVGATAEADEQELTRTFTDPGRYDGDRLFPGKSWEFTTWKWYDYLGFFGLWLGVLGVIGVLFLVLGLGARH